MTNQAAATFSVRSRWLYESDSRVDASNYATGALDALRVIHECALPTAQLGVIASKIWHPVQNQARSNFRRVYTRPQFGVPFVGSRSMLELPMRVERHLSRRIPRLADLMVPSGWILISRSGTVGNPIVVSERLSGVAITEHAIRVAVKEPEAGYVYAYLASRYGKALIGRGVFGATVDELEPSHLAEIPVPLPPRPERRRIASLIDDAYRERDRAHDSFVAADELLHAVLGITPFTEEDVEYMPAGEGARAFVLSSHDLNGRLDASQHIPITRSAINKLLGGQLRLAHLGDLCDEIWIPPRFKREYVLHGGVYYLLPSQLLTQRPYGLKRLSQRQADRLKDLALREGQLLLTTDGTVGRAHLVTKRMSGWIGSNNMARLSSTSIDLGYLYAFLATPYGQHQVARDIYGGVVDHISETHIASVLCPVPNRDDESAIGDLVRSAFRSKDRANELEDEAIDRIERVIGASSGAAA